MATLNFNAHEVEPSVAFEAVPAGKYIAVIVDSEIKQTKSGNGNYLELTFEITEGEYKGRKVWARLNIDNPNADAVKIARGELSAICRAVNVMTPNDSVDLHNLPLEINVKCKKRDNSDEISNEIKGYAAKSVPVTSSEPRQQSAPWKR
ncbi:MAG: DUF669 domain-containing protein [Victivallaceae bacterium]|jgi:hypothetical protein|nr:DUF669 domain-containing protein [Victivallaceae bacterium]